MRIIITWVLLGLALVLGLGWYFTSASRQTNVELARITELEGEQSEGDSAVMRAVLLSTPSEKIRDEVLKKVAALRESASVLRDDIEAAYDSVTPEQERMIDHIRRHATELESLAVLDSSRAASEKPIVDKGRLDLYRLTVLAYGAGNTVARQMRRETGIPHRLGRSRG